MLVKNKLSVIVVLLILVSVATSTFAITGGDTVPILDLKAGGKATAMGGAFVSISDDATAILWNPAGLVGIDGDELTLFYDALGGFAYHLGFFGYARNLTKFLTMGVGVKFLTTGIQEDYSGSFSTFDELQYLFLVSAGFNFPFPLKAGVTLKLGLRDFTWEDGGNDYSKSAQFFNMDVGFLYPVASFYSIGLKIENIIPNLDFGLGDADEPVYTMVTLGNSFALFDNKLRFAVDIDYITSINEFDYHLGLEYRLFSSFSVYGGLDSSKLTFGINLYITDFSFYFSTKLVPNLGPSARFGLHYMIGKKKREYRSIEKQMNQLTIGLDSFTKGDYVKARRYFKKVLDENPKNETARRLSRMAKNRLSGGQWKTDKDKAYIKKNFEQGVRHFKAKEWAKSRKRFKMVLEVDPLHWKSRDYVDKIDKIVKDKVEHHYRVAVDSFIKNELEKAKKSLVAVLKLKPNYRQSRELYERIKLIQKRAWERRTKEQRRISNADIYYKRGMAFFKRNIYIDAAESFRLSLGYMESRRTRYYYDLAKKRLKELKVTEHSRSKSMDYYKLGMQLAKNNQLKKAIKNLEKALNYYPKNSVAEKALTRIRKKMQQYLDKPVKEGLALFKQGKYLEALAKWKLALKIDPEYEPAKQYIKNTAKEMKERSRYNLQIADSLYKRGRDADILDAMKYYKNAYVLDNKNTRAKRGWERCKARFEKKAKTLFQRAFLAFKSNKLSKLNEAISNFEKYLLIKPEDKQAKQFLADAKLRKKKNRTAFIFEARKSEGIDLFNNRDYERARLKFREALQYDKNNRAILSYLKRCDQRIKLMKNRNVVMDLFNKGIAAYKKREYQKAIDIWKGVDKLKNASSSDKRMIREYIKTAEEVKKYNQNKFFIMGKQFADSGQLLKARDALSEALNINKNHSKARSLLNDVRDRIRGVAFKQLKKGSHEYDIGQYAKSVKSLEKGLLYNKDDDRIKNKLEEARDNLKLLVEGNKFYKAGKLSKAIVSYEKIRQNNKKDRIIPKKIDSLSKRLSEQTDQFVTNAEKQIKAKNYNEALVTIRLILNLVKYKSDARSRDITKKHALSLQDKARKLMIVVLRRNYTMGYRFYARRAYKQALVYFNRAFTYDRNYKNLRTYRRVCLNNVLAAQQAAAKRNQNRIQALLYRGIYLYRQGKYQAAINVWAGILRISPNHAGARSYIARARFKLGR